MPNFCKIELGSIDVGMCIAETPVQQRECDYHTPVYSSIQCYWRHEAGWCTCWDAQQDARKEAKNEAGKAKVPEVPQAKGSE